MVSNYLSFVNQFARTSCNYIACYTFFMDFAQAFRGRQKQRMRRTSGALLRLKLVKWIVLFGLGGVFASFLLLAAAFAWYSRDLPSPDKVVRREGFSTKILARGGESLYDVHGDVAREPVNFNDVPVYLREATVAVEDKNFYQHQGFDPLGMARALFNTAVRGKLQGGSTLTQQLVKNVLLTSERSLPRKLKEFVLSVQIEKRFTKDQILQMYLQEAPYGGSAVGVETAAQAYFGKHVSDLSLVESAILAGMPQAPSRYSPYGPDPNAYIGRAEHVLRRMKEDGYITSDQEKQTDDQLPKVQFQPTGAQIQAPHFVMYVRDLLTQQFGEGLVENGGLKVTTTLDFPLQQKAQGIVSEEIDKVKKSLNISNGAALVVNPLNGEILAMVGSKDFSSKEIDGQVNVTLRPRQPGSAIKPITYAAAFHKGFTPATMFVDAKTTFDSGDPDKPYEPENYDGKFRGPVQLRYALGSSLNVPSVKLLQLVGLPDMLNMAHQMGISTLDATPETLRRVGLSVTLGGGEVKLIDLVAAYSAFSNGGMRVDPVSILKVEDPSGKVLFEHKSVKGKQVLTPQEAFLVTNILSDNNARLLTFGQNSLLNMGARPVAVKTGTTNDKRDNWAIGWSRTAIVGAWVGNNDNSQMKEVASGVSGASPIWRRIMLESLTAYPSVDFQVPPGIVQKDVDVISGYTAHDGWPSRPEYFIDGSVPDSSDPIHAKMTVCKADGKLAGPVEIAKGDTEDREFLVLKAPLTLPKADQDRWQKGIDDWAATQGYPRYRPPADHCGSTNGIVIQAKQPTDQTTITGTNNVDWEVSIASSSNPNKVEIFVNGITQQTLTQAPWRSTINLPDGMYTLKFKVRIDGGQEAESGDIRIGVNRPWNATPTPSPTVTVTPTPTPTPQ